MESRHLGPSATLDAATREELLTLSHALSRRAGNITKHWSKMYLLARPFEDVAPLQAKLHEDREAIMRSLELRTPPWYILDPGGTVKRVWNAAACTLIFLDVLYVPFLIAYFSPTTWWAPGAFPSSP